MRNKQQKQQENGFFLSFVCSTFATENNRNTDKGTAQRDGPKRDEDGQNVLSPTRNF